MKIDATLSYQRGAQIGIGEGMNSKVFEALDHQFAGKIAVKEIPKAFFANPLTDYYQEAQRLFAVGHKNVVPIFYAGQSASDICLAMPLFSKGSLTRRLVNGPLRLTESLRVSLGVLNGLMKVHQAGLVHLDIKPSNVLFADDDTPLLADFGQARSMNSGGLVSVPEMYLRVMPPETLLTNVAGVHSDIYQMGLLLYRAVNGEPYYQDQVAMVSPGRMEERISRGKFPPRDAFLPHVPSRLKTAIRKALRIDPADRFPSAYEFADELARIELPRDWACTVSPNGAKEWRCTPADRAEIIVKSAPDSQGLMTIEVFSVSKGVTRRRDVNGLWKKGLTPAQEEYELTAVFDSL